MTEQEEVESWKNNYTIGYLTSLYRDLQKKYEQIKELEQVFSDYFNENLKRKVSLSIEEASATCRIASETLRNIEQKKYPPAEQEGKEQQ